MGNMGLYHRNLNQWWPLQPSRVLFCQTTGSFFLFSRRHQDPRRRLYGLVKFIQGEDLIYLLLERIRAAAIPQRVPPPR